VTAGSLPPDLTLNTTTGVLSGTPTAAGSYSFTVTVSSGTQTQSRAYAMAVALPPVSITTTSPLPSATIGAVYSKALQASGGAGAGSYGWALANGTTLPAGLSLSSAGVISGTPSALGTTSFDVTVTSGTGATAVSSTRTFSLSVINPTDINLTFSVAPSKSVCYAAGVPMTPGIVVRVTDQGGNLLSGVAVSMVAVTNNGSKVAVTPPSMVSSGGFASFGGPTINKTGGYALIASTTAPLSASITSAKFTISPSCP
jgi:large repetitive protein